MANLRAVVAVLVAFAVSPTVDAQQNPFITKYGSGVVYAAGPQTAESENLHVSVEFYSGTAFADLNAHFAIGGRGRTLSNPAGIPAGRGIAIGSFSQSHVGACRGVMIEDFTDNQGASGAIPDANDGGEMNDHDGLVGPCHPVNFKNFTTYKVDLLISKLNVYWFMSELTSVGWLQVGEGGCYENTGVFCPEDPFDRGFGDAFVANAGLGSGSWWQTRTPVIAKF